jgi:homoserine dehydrogenase
MTLRFGQDRSLVTNILTLPADDEVEPPLRVLKFGGSILRSAQDLRRVAGEIYRQVRSGGKVIAVVSAFDGETDQLIEQCRQAGGFASNFASPDAVSLGEEKSAHLLRIACDRIGLRAFAILPEAFGILTEGPHMDSRPIGLTGDPRIMLRAHDVLIMPGYVGLDKSGRRTLLGRGGSDFSAIFLAGESGAELRLYKDVDGVYDHDPAADPRNLKRYARVSWQQCLTIARPLLQPRAVEYASARELAIEVGAIGSTTPTIVATASSRPTAVKSRAKLRIGLAGFGTVGQAAQRRLQQEPEFEVAAILVRDPGKARDAAPVVPPTCDATTFFESRFDVLVEATSEAEGGKRLCLRHLAGMHDVVSANKAAVAANLRALLSLSRRWGGRLRYSAAVGGSAPMLELVRRARSRGPVAEAAGILNGTVNFLLDAMAGGMPFDAALDAARTAGFAEADPAADLSGADAAAKLRILAVELWGNDGLDIPIEVQGFDADLRARIEAGAERWLQLSKLERRGQRIGESVRFVPASTLSGFPPLPAEWNHLQLLLAGGERLCATGRGAGGAATAEAVMADLYDIVAHRAA